MSRAELSYQQDAADLRAEIERLRVALREAVDTLYRAGARDTAKHCAKALEE